MGDIIVKKLSPAPVYTYNIRNMSDLTLELDVPVVVYEIPESSDEDAIGMKVEGNKSVVNVSWTLVDESTTVVDELTGGNSVQTADEQMVFLMNDFQPTGVEFAYEIKLMPNSGSTPFFTREGILTKMSISKSGNAPVTYTANMVFSTATMLAKKDNTEVNQ